MRPQKELKFWISGLRKVAVAASPQASQCPAVLWIKQTSSGGGLVHVVLSRLSHHWIFFSLTQGGRAMRARREAPGPLSFKTWLVGGHSQLLATPLSHPGLPPPRLWEGRRKMG